MKYVFASRLNTGETIGASTPASATNLNNAENIWCYSSIFSVCDPQSLFSLPRYTLTPSPPYPLPFCHSLPSHRPVWFMNWGWYSDTFWCATPPLSKLHFNEPNPPDELQYSSFWHLAHFMQSGAGGAFEGGRSRLQCCTSHSVWEEEAWPRHIETEAGLQLLFF